MSGPVEHTKPTTQTSDDVYLSLLGPDWRDELKEIEHIIASEINTISFQELKAEMFDDVQNRVTSLSQLLTDSELSFAGSLYAELGKRKYIS